MRLVERVRRGLAATSLSLALTVLLLVLAAVLIGRALVLLAGLAAMGCWRAAAARPRTARRARTTEGVREVTDAELEEVAQSEEELPDVAAAVFVSLADRYAAEGRWAEAVRERLRAMVRELVDRGVIEHRPGWTVTELARAAGSATAVVAPAVEAASNIFSDIWYAQQPGDRRRRQPDAGHWPRAARG